MISKIKQIYLKLARVTGAARGVLTAATHFPRN